MALKNTVSIRQALQYVADHPNIDVDRMLELPAYELVGHTLFQIANGAELGDPRSQARANSARKLILDRLVGKRRTGTHPATRKEQSIEFKDLTRSEVESGE